MRTLVTILFVLLSSPIFACSCVIMGGIQRYARAEFVAKVKVLDTKPAPKKEGYHILKIDILELYKGEKVDKLYLHSQLNTSCAFYIPANTTWLIYAHQNKVGEISFGLCSAPKQINRVFNSQKYPNAEKNYKESLKLKFEVLEHLKKKNINPTNEFNLPLFIKNNSLDNFKGADLKKEKFALYEITVNKDLSINKIKPIKEFTDKKISKKILEILKGNLEVGNTDLTKIPQKVKLILPLYYYSAENGNPSFISRYDL